LIHFAFTAFFVVANHHFKAWWNETSPEWALLLWMWVWLITRVLQINAIPNKSSIEGSQKLLTMAVKKVVQ